MAKGMKSVTKGFGSVDVSRLPWWHPHGLPNVWLETLQDMACTVRFSPVRLIECLQVQVPQSVWLSIYFRSFSCPILSSFNFRVFACFN